MSNEIALENQKQGNPESEWGLANGASSSIQGFTTDISTNVGGSVDLKINTDSDHYRLDIYRLGYYNGDGARLVGSIEHNGAVNQPAPIVDRSTATVDAGNWSVTDTWSMPSDAVSGVYIAKLVREDGIQGENQIPFIVRNDASHSDIVLQTSDTTWQAYNTWGGASLYTNTLGTGANRAYAVSYNRPLSTTAVDSLFSVDYAAIRYLESNGYDVSYIAGVDTARSGSNLLLQHKLFLSEGHDEYWSADQRAHVEAARDAGVNLAFWGGNDVYWETRWGASLDSTPDAYRTLITYKESKGDAVDPSPQWTGAWVDGRSPNGAHPQNALTGTMFTVTATRHDTISVSSDYSKLLFWANTDVANLQPGQSIKLAPGTLGAEWESDLDNGFRPAGLIDLSSTTVTVNTLVSNPSIGDSSKIVTGNATHNLTLYRAASGALVFSAGTIDWNWALDAHNPGGVKADPNVQQAMINLLAQMGIQPETLQSGLVYGIQSTDHAAPQTAISSAAGVFKVGGHVTVTGTAQDFGGGIVAGVEFSGDSGLTWHKATGWENWHYTWTPDKIGRVTVEARSVDDSLNLGSLTSTTVSVGFKVAGFDPGYYLKMNPDVKAAGIDPFTHYMRYGWIEGRNPNEVFSTKDYLDANPDVAASGVNPLMHFETYGWKEGRDPSPNFDLEFYLKKNPDVAATGTNPLDHYIVYGQYEARNSHASIGKVNSIGFDQEYYLFNNADVAQTKMNAFTHYLHYGEKEARDPNPYFDTSYYLANNLDVAGSSLNPLEHYDRYGWKEGRNPSPNFDTNAYLAANPDVAAAHIDPLVHFLKYGIYEGRDPMGGTHLSA